MSSASASAAAARPRATHELERGRRRAGRSQQLGADPLVVVIATEAIGARADDRGDDATERAETAVELADVVQQRAGHLVARPAVAERLEAAGDHDRVAPVGAVSRRHSVQFAGEELRLGPRRVGRRRARGATATTTNRRGEVGEVGDGLSSRSSAEGARVSRAVDLQQPLLADLRVHLRRRDRGMAEQLLHDAQVGAVVEQVGRARVAQHVR